MIRPGPANHIIDVPGINIGHAHDSTMITGVSVVLPDRPAVAAVDCRGGAPCTRETELMRPENLVEEIHAIVLSGGSTQGLDAASGVSDWLREEHRGFQIGKDLVVPIVPSACIFDLNNGGDKSDLNPGKYRQMGYEAVSSAVQETGQGNFGAGMGAKAGTLKGGMGSVSLMDDEGNIVGALSVSNPFGSVTLPDRPEFWAWPFERESEFGGLPPPSMESPLPLNYDQQPFFQEVTNTTLMVVALNVELTRSEALRVAIMAQDGLARAVRPSHCPNDGDTLFVLCTGDKKFKKGDTATLYRLGMMAADCIARSIARGVYEAESMGRWPSYRDHFNLNQI